MIKLILQIIFTLFFAFILLFVWSFIGPHVYVDYVDCMDTKEHNITDEAIIYEVIFNNKKEEKQYSKFTYKIPPLCVEENSQDTICRDHYSLNQLHTKKVLFTGRVMKTYCFNEFCNDSYLLEVLINNKKYWVGEYDYDDMLLGSYRNRDFKRGFKVEICPIYTIRDFGSIR